MVLPADQDEPAHEVRAPQRDVQRGRRAVAEPDEVRRTADDLLDERGDVGGEELEVERTVDVGAAAVPRRSGV